MYQLPSFFHQNTISLIMHETCFVMKSVHIRQYIARIMVETWLILCTTETTSQGNFNPDQTWTMFEMADGCRKEKSAQNNQNCGYYKATCLVEIWANEEIQQQLSAMGRKQNIWKNITARLSDKCEYKETAFIQPCMKRVWNRHLMWIMHVYSNHVSALMLTQLYTFDFSIT